MFTSTKPLANLLIDVDAPSLAVTAPIATTNAARPAAPVTAPRQVTSTLPLPRTAVRVDIDASTRVAVAPAPAAPKFAPITPTYTPAQRHQLKLLALADLGPGLVHDLNNLMMIISARVMLAHTCAGVADRVETHLSAIDTSAERARETMRSMLAMIRPESPEVCEFDLACAVCETAALLRRLLPVGVRVNVELPETPAAIVGSPDQFRQLILHLAVRSKFMINDSGEILLSVCFDGSKQARLSVLHAGVRPAQTGMLQQTESHLLVAASIARDHGGTLTSLESRNPGEPSSVSMLLPLARPTAVPATVEQEGAASRPWLLLVTSNDELRQRVADAIGPTGLPLVTVESLNSAQVRSSHLDADSRPSGIIVDSSCACPQDVANISGEMPCLVADERGLTRPQHVMASKNEPIDSQIDPCESDIGVFGQTVNAADVRHSDSLDFDAVAQWVEELTANRARRSAESHVPALLD